MGVEISIDTLTAKLAEIERLDEEIASFGDQASAGKRAIRNQLTEEYSELWNEQLDRLVAFLSDQPDEIVVGVYAGLTSGLKNKFETQVTSYLDSQAEARKTETPQVSEAEMAAKYEEAKKLRKEYSAIKGVMELFPDLAEQVANLPEPKRVYTSRGARGPQAMSLIVYSVNGTPLPAADNSPAGIGKFLGFEKDDSGTPAKKFRQALVAAFGKDEEGNDKFDIQNPPETWEVTLDTPKGSFIVSGQNKEDDEAGTEAA